MSIADAVVDCADAFQRVRSGLITSDASDEGMQRTYSDFMNKVNACFERFQLWSSNLGAHRRDKNSLDRRLSEASNLQGRVLQYLKDIQEGLEDINDIISGKTTPWDEQSESSSEETDLEDDPEDETELGQLTKYVDNAVSCLLRISTVIQKPAPHDRFIKSGKFDQSFRQKWDEQHVSDKFASIPGWMAVRLGKANSRRRQFLEYRKNQHEQIVDMQPIEEENKTIISSLPSAIKRDANLQNMAGSEAACVVDDPDDRQSQTSYAETVANEDTLLVPAMPENAAEGSLFECPYCFMIVGGIHNRMQWKRHVYTDLQPYICLHAGCISADETFARWHDWINHDTQFHRKLWRCNLGCSSEFSFKSQIRDHLVEVHGLHDASDHHLDALSVHVGIDIPKILLCHLCGQESSTLMRYYKHVGRHLEQLALFVIPRDCLEEVDETLDDNEDRASIHAEPKANDDEEDNIEDSIEERFEADTGSTARPEAAMVGERQPNDQPTEVEEQTEEGSRPSDMFEAVETPELNPPTIGSRPSAEESPDLPNIDPNAVPGPIPATTPLAVRQDQNGVQWIAFEYVRERVKMEYTIRCDIETINLYELTQEFKIENCVYPRAMVNKDHYVDDRLQYETEYNGIGWALAQLNPVLRGKRGLIQRAVDSWRNSNQDPRLRSRRVRRTANINTGNNDWTEAPEKAGKTIESEEQTDNQSVSRETGGESGASGRNDVDFGVDPIMTSPTPDQPSSVRFSDVDTGNKPEKAVQPLHQLTGSNKDAQDSLLSAEAEEELRNLSSTLQQSRSQAKRMANFSFEPVSLPASRAPSPSVDPELALALRMSFEAEKARQEKEKKFSEEAEGETEVEPIADRGGKQPSQADELPLPSSSKRWFMPGEGLSQEALAATQHYLGLNASVTPGFDPGGASGFWITAHRNLTSEEIKSLKLDSQLWEAEKAVAESKTKSGVSKEGQELFDFISRTLPTRWSNDQIVVNDAVVIQPPYNLDNILAPAEKAMSETYVRKILEFFYRRKKNAEDVAANSDAAAMPMPDEEDIPMEASGVTLADIMIKPSSRYRPGDTIHMAEIANSLRVKNIYHVFASRYNPSGGYIEYQLKDPLTQALHKEGAWFRERDMRLEHRDRTGSS